MSLKKFFAESGVNKQTKKMIDEIANPTVSMYNKINKYFLVFIFIIILVIIIFNATIYYL